MKQFFHGLRLAVGPAAGAALFFAFSPSVRKAAAHCLKGSHAPAAVAADRLQPVGSLAETNRLHLDIGLPLRNQADLDQFLKQLYDPNSPNYHHYLSWRSSRRDSAQQGYAASDPFAQQCSEAVTIHRMMLQVDASVA